MRGWKCRDGCERKFKLEGLKIDKLKNNYFN